jgi:DNA repair ATPase RecN
MGEKKTIFKTEENVIEEVRAVLQDAKYQDNPLLNDFSSLFKRYHKLYKQLRRLITLSDQQQLKLKEYVQEVEHLTNAAAAVEAETFDPDSLSGVVARPDELGQLARVFQRMAREVSARQQQLQQQVQELRIELNEAKQHARVAEIAETDYFRDLQKKAQHLRDVIQQKTEHVTRGERAQNDGEKE